VKDAAGVEPVEVLPAASVTGLAAVRRAARVADAVIQLGGISTEHR